MPLKCEKCGKCHTRKTGCPSGGSSCSLAADPYPLEAGQVRYDNLGDYKIMAINSGYAMARRKGAIPFVKSVKEIESNTMSEQRFREICSNQTETLTTREMELGWHFCDELDGSLENKNNLDFCNC